MTLIWLKLEILINSNLPLKKFSTLPKPEKSSKMYSPKNLKEQHTIWEMHRKSLNNLPEQSVPKLNNWESQDTKLQFKSFMENWKDKDLESHQSHYGIQTLTIGLPLHLQMKQFTVQGSFSVTILSDFFISDLMNKKINLCLLYFIFFDGFLLSKGN